MAENSLQQMLSSVMANPEAMAMLTRLLGGDEGQETAETSSQEEADVPKEVDTATPEDTAPVGLLTRGHSRKGGGRRELFLAMRPYLSKRRCASVDRMLRAMELYEIIEETQLLKGGK